MDAEDMEFLAGASLDCDDCGAPTDETYQADQYNSFLCEECYLIRDATE